MDRRVHEVGGQGASGSSERAKVDDQETGGRIKEGSSQGADNTSNTQGDISEEDKLTEKDLEEPFASLNGSAFKTKAQRWWGKLEDPWLAWFCVFVSALVLVTRICLKLRKCTLPVFAHAARELVREERCQKKEKERSMSVFQTNLHTRLSRISPVHGGNHHYLLEAHTMPHITADLCRSAMSCLQIINKCGEKKTFLCCVSSPVFSTRFVEYDMHAVYLREHTKCV